MIKKLRKAAGMSQSKLADRAGVSLKIIQALEQGWRDPAKMKLENAIAIANALGIRPEDLIE